MKGLSLIGKNVENILKIWVDELNTGGLLFIDELEDIATDVAVFHKYLELNTQLVASQGGQMFIGKFLGKRFDNLNVIFSDSRLAVDTNMHFTQLNTLWFK